MVIVFWPFGSGPRVRSWSTGAFNPRYSVDRGVGYQIELNESTELWGTLAKTFGDFPPTANETGFRLNRVTGEASVSNLHKPSDAEAVTCMKGPKALGIYCEDALVLADYNQTGKCAVVDRTIK
jgi:hypothetical protein